MLVPCTENTFYWTPPSHSSILSVVVEAKKLGSLSVSGVRFERKDLALTGDPRVRMKPTCVGTAGATFATVYFRHPPFEKSAKILSSTTQVAMFELVAGKELQRTVVVRSRLALVCTLPCRVNGVSTCEEAVESWFMSPAAGDILRRSKARTQPKVLKC